MRTEWALIIGLMLTCQGCSPLAHVARTIFVEPVEYPRRIGDLMDDCRNKELAEAEWATFQQANPEHPFPRDFYLGFIDGYADYLYAGGNGNPPPVPPRWYWRGENETAEGRQAIQDWFDGFRQGAARAKASGVRELVTLPLSSPPPRAPLPAAILPPQAARPLPVPQLPSEHPPTETLPEPRKVPIEPGKEGAR